MSSRCGKIAKTHRKIKARVLKTKKVMAFFFLRKNTIYMKFTSGVEVQVTPVRRSFVSYQSSWTPNGGLAESEQGE